MAATGFTPVYIYASGTTGHIPLAANLTNTSNGSEIALNYADGNLFFKNASNSVITAPLLQSSSSQNGWLSSTDWSTFNGKAPAVTYTTNYIPYGQGTTTPALSSSFQFNGTTLTVGATTSSWSGAGNIIQVNQGSIFGGLGAFHFAENTYYDGAAYRYIVDGFATDHYQLNGTFVWRNAASGTAGNTFAWTDRMILDASGNITTATWNGTAIGATYGGTGQTSYAVGDILYASSTTALSKLADVATGNALISGGVNTAPSWGKIGLTTHISGTLAVGNGGTGASSASITAFNNITGYTASGATGTTSTNLVFSAIPTFGTTIGVGNATAAASGAGISFPASQSASTDVNTLDDYKEGTFTPSVSATSGSITSFGTLSGKYTKIGNQVTVVLSLPITNNGTGAGSLKVSNMPYTCGASDSFGAGREQQSTGNGLFGYINGSTTNLYIQRYDGAYPGGTNYTIGFTVTYFV